MVNLTDEEKRMLDGELGPVPQKCMAYLVEECEVSGADHLVDLDGTGDFHTPWTSMSPHYEFSLEELRDLVESGAHFKIPTFANKTPFPFPTPMQGWQGCGMSPHNEPEYHEKAMQKEYLNLYKRMGLMDTHSCAYYLTSSYWPTMGQHCAWNESSAIPYANAVLGARANIDGNFATCFLGKAAYYDMHVTEQRYASILVKTDRLIRTDMEWDVFGFTVGEKCGIAVPCLTGTAKPNTTQLCKLNAAMNTGGSVRMYHIPGTTPEAPCVEAAFGGNKPAQEMMINEADLRKSYETLNSHDSDEVDFVSLGCPHYNIVDLMLLARKLEGKKLKVMTWVMTLPWLYDVARNLGYLKIFEDAGANLMTGTCPACMAGVPQGCRHIAVDSAKQSYYITGCYPDGEDRLHVCYGTQEDCIDAALTGRWHGQWR
jgi:predicted aconitase